MSDQSSAPPTDRPAADSPQGPIDPPRRSFLTKFMAGALGILAGAIPFLTGTLFFLDPLIRKRSRGETVPGGVVKDEHGFLKMAITVDALPDNGTPQRFTVYDDIINAWNKFPNQPIGSIWLRKIEGQVIAFNTVCPHLGCSVEHRDATGDFFCPCHNSSFALDGTKTNVIPPRNLDALELRVDGQEIWIKYQDFRAALSEKVPV